MIGKVGKIGNEMTFYWRLLFYDLVFSVFEFWYHEGEYIQSNNWIKQKIDIIHAKTIRYLRKMYQFYINDILTIIEKYIMALKNFPNS